ncbi:hypothetical protein COV24_03085 [candidate division WWE3 bacterium CG10_big_fil_rev_8_21_14_0_10_32_10]|uniref:N-acetyltransferase domain-containing protein n=1 Tax=candidate division WWE3 bacterium CG10_big_fil_rev_8_21_14_0_10_32_10 TaxID=1975090 RepID=A0A2H0RBK1_UNCKA|nr:MAG: hypothetical protein COV24_03085 [candidate division WWE3 bacterium CG10_big_fil_rev_8_21_14_0_10_32_10]
MNKSIIQKAPEEGIDIKNNETETTIIHATEKNLDEVWLIISECAYWLQSKGMNHWTECYTREVFLEKLRSENFEVYLLSKKDPVVATITIGKKCPQYYIENEEGVNYIPNFKDPESQEVLYITALGVRPKYQGRGYAKSLMTFAEQQARTTGVKYIRFDARGDYTKLVEFYTKLGYRIKGDMPDPDSPYLLFEKEITYQ